MPREAYSDQFKRDAVAMYEDHSHVSLKAAVKELGTDLGSRGVGWEGVGKLGGRGLDSEQGESGGVRGACQVVCVWGWVYRYLSKRSG